MTAIPLKKFPQYMYAWMGMDEHGSGQVGIKQGLAPAGYIPLVAVDRDLEKLKRLKPQLQAQAAAFGKKIYLVRYRVDGVEDCTNEGQ